MERLHLLRLTGMRSVLQLTKLIDGICVGTGNISADPDISGLTADSRLVAPGFLFVVLSGSQSNGLDYLEEAVNRGASAILLEADKSQGLHAEVPIVVSENPRRCLSLIAAKLYPSQPKVIAAVTGTNGKTSVVSFLRQIWSLSGETAASIGTLGLDAPGIEPVKFPFSHPNLTTPDPVSMHQMLEHLASNNVECVAIEASSHGLDQYRVDGVRVTMAGFTNLTREHVDYHGSIEQYLKAKLRLFGKVMKPGGAAILNRDSCVFDEIARVCTIQGHRIIHYGRAGRDGLTDGIDLIELRLGESRLFLTLHFEGEIREVNIPVTGHFQAENIMCSLGLAISGGMPFRVAVETLPKLVSVRGRMEFVGHKSNGAAIFIDYAHTPDALSRALSFLKDRCSGKLVLVFGCGGDRDHGKRLEMGRIAHDWADTTIVTDDNPRTEVPAEIRAQIMVGCPESLEVADRGEAIREAISMLDFGDLLLIAGKGHEDYQIVGKEKFCFSDLEIVQRTIKESTHSHGTH